MLYFKMSYQLQIIPVRGPECGAPFGGCAQHLPVIQRKEKIIMEEKNEKKSVWGIILKVIIVVATAIGSAFGVTACI